MTSDEIRTRRLEIVCDRLELALDRFAAASPAAADAVFPPLYKPDHNGGPVREKILNPRGSVEEPEQGDPDN